jgi:hypothetical protein
MKLPAHSTFPRHVSFLPGVFRFLVAIFALLIPLLDATHAELRINEIMAAGQAVLPDEDGAFPDWLEVFNAGPEAVDLGGWHLTDDTAKSMEWTFPARTLGAGEYLVVFASAKNRRPAEGPLHTSFRLTSAGEYLALTRPDGSIAHAIQYPMQIPDIAFDGADFLTAATPGAVNAALLAITRAQEFSQPHGFYEQPFRVALTSGTPDAQIRYTLDGTEPTATRGTLYVKPIRIAATSVLRAVALAPDAQPSPVVTRTYLFLNDVVQQSPDGSAPPGCRENGPGGCGLRDGPAHHATGAVQAHAQGRPARCPDALHRSGNGIDERQLPAPKWRDDRTARDCRSTRPQRRRLLPRAANRRRAEPREGVHHYRRSAGCHGHFAGASAFTVSN